MANINNFKIHYATQSIIELPALFSLAMVLETISDNHENTGEEPDFIELPTGSVIVYNAYVAHYFFAKGHITETQFINLSQREVAA